MTDISESGVAPVAAYDSTRCDLCGSENAVVVIDLPAPCLTTDGRLVKAPLRKIQCPDCGLIRSADSISEEVLLDHYRIHYGLGINSRVAEPMIFLDGQMKPRSQVVHAWIMSVLEDAGRSSFDSMLEVGCGEGALLKCFHAANPEAKILGFEPNKGSVEIARSAGLNVSSDDMDQSDAQFDLICSVAVIEHTPSPRKFLQGLRKRLREGGAVVLIYPCQDDANRDILFWDHLYHFHSGHVARLASDLGFQEIKRSLRRQGLPGFALSVLGKTTKRSIPIPVPDIGPTVRASAERWSSIFRDIDRWLDEVSGRDLMVLGLGEAFDLVRGYTNLKRRAIAMGFDDNVLRFRDRDWGFPVDTLRIEGINAAKAALLVTFTPGAELQEKLDAASVPIFILKG